MRGTHDLYILPSNDNLLEALTQAIMQDKIYYNIPSIKTSTNTTIFDLKILPISLPVATAFASTLIPLI